jgi:hypothetical protein
MSVESSIAVLETKTIQTDHVLERLVVSFDKKSDVANSLTKIIAVHELKLDNQEKLNKEFDKTIENASIEHRKTNQEFLLRMDQITFSLKKEITDSEIKTLEAISNLNKTIKESQTQHIISTEKLEKRISTLENWRWYLIGISTTLGFVASQGISLILKHYT